MRQDIDKIVVSSGKSWFGWSTAYGYQTSAWLGRLRLHVFWREDPGEAFHDHPWRFTTLPLVSYVEEVLVPGTGGVYRQVVRAWQRSRRPAQHAHRVLGRWAGHGTATKAGAVVTLCWRGLHERDWQYMLVRGMKVVRFPWQQYLRRVDSKPRRLVDG